ncbi:Signal recognition particle [Venturia inaequalis]|nr:Signal recognition particle [Venturia inaequalis]
MVDFIKSILSSIPGFSQEKEESIPEQEDAQPPNSSPNTLREEPSQPSPSHSLNIHSSTSSGLDASRTHTGPKKTTANARSTSDEERLLPNYRIPADATYIKAPRGTPPRSMPPNKYTTGGFKPRNTLDNKTLTPHPGSRGALATVTSRGENVKHLAPFFYDFQEPESKRRKKDHPRPSKEDLRTSNVIDLAQYDDPPPPTAIDKTSRIKKQKPLHIPPSITGVQESRNVNRMMSSSFAGQDFGAQLSQVKPLRGETQDQPLELEDDLMTELDNNLELQQANSPNKRRPGSTATTSHHFANTKRSKVAKENFVDHSDDELREVARPLTNGLKKNGHAVAEPILRRTFRPDDRVPRSNRSAFNENEEDEDMADELAETPENRKRTSGSSKQAEKTLSESETFEIPETPSPPKEDYKSPADIPPTFFSHSENGTTKNGKGMKKKSSKAQRENVYPLTSYRDLRNQIGQDQSGLQLELNDSETSFDLRFCDDKSFPVATIEIAQIMRLMWSLEDSRLIRLTGSRDSDDSRARVWDLEFSGQASAKNFVLHLNKSVKRHTKQPEEMRRMFDTGRLEAANQPPRDSVSDRGVEDAFYERKAHWETIAPSAPNQRSTPSRPSKSRPLVSALKASVPDDIQSESREKRLPETKHENETEVQSTNRRPIRSTRANKAPVRSLTPEIEKYSVKNGLGEPWDQPVVYPGRDKTVRSKKQVSVEFDDLFRLDEGEWFNDSLVEYCLLCYQQQNQMQAKKVYFFSNFFYSKLVAKPGRNIDYEAVKRWVKEDIFTYDFVVVPVCENAHWYLALICNLSHLERRLTDDDGDAVEEVKVESLEHEGQTETATTSVPEDTANTAEHQTRQVDFDKNRDDSSGHLEINVSEDKDALDLVDTKAEDMKEVPDLNDGAHADSISDNHAKDTATPGTKKKARRHPAVRKKYAPDTPAIAILDSMPMGAKHGNTVNALKDFLVAEADFKRNMAIKRESLQGMHITKGIPMQDNFSDCGLFLCRYVRELLKDPEGFCSKLFGGELDKIAWGYWDTNEVRATIRDELQALAAEQAKQRKDAKAEKRRLKRAALPNASVETATEASTLPSDTPANLLPLSPIKASSPLKAPSPVGAPRPHEAVAAVESLANPRNPPRSPARSSNAVLQSSSTHRVSKKLERMGSEDPHFSARSSPADRSLYFAHENSIPICEDDAQDVVPDREPRGLMGEDSEDVMLHDEQQEGEEPEWRGCDDGVQDDDEQIYRNQLIEALGSTGGGENVKDDHMDVDGSDAVFNTSEVGPRSSSPATRSQGSQNLQGIPPLPFVRGTFGG